MMPPRSFFTTTANEGGGECCNFDLLKNEYNQNVIDQQTRSSKSDSCMHTNHKNHANDKDHKSRRERERNRKQGSKGRQVSKRSVGAGSFDGQQLGGTVCAGVTAIRTLSV